MLTSREQRPVPTIYDEHQRLLRRIIGAYDSPMVRAYCLARFVIININMLHILRLCMRGKLRILEIGCGFGLFGCYFASRDRRVQYHGIDLNAGRIEMANRAAARLGLSNIRFDCGDACGSLDLAAEYDVVLMMDLMHHIPDTGKRSLLQTVTPRLHPEGRLIIKEISRKPAWKLAFTWALDVVMTKSFDMWYWNAGDFRAAVDPEFGMEVYPISDLLPYPHVVYLFSREGLGSISPVTMDADALPLVPRAAGQ